MLTYRDLKKQLAYMDEEALDQNITVVAIDSGKVLPVIDHVLGWESKDPDEYTDHDWAMGLDSVDGVLDEGHPYLTISY